MEIHTISVFVPYFNNIRERTMRTVRCIPPDKLDWSYAPGKFTLGDLARHIAITERFVFVAGAVGSKNSYPGCGKEFAATYDEVVTFMQRLHSESMTLLETLTDADLQRKCASPEGTPITTWKLLRAMVEHEVHHRGELYAALGVLGVAVPPLYGVTSEQLRELASVK